MNERLEINIGTTSLPGYYIDYHTTIRLASPSPITMEAYRYGGICIRTREDWNDQTAEMLTSEGLSRDEADGSRAPLVLLPRESRKRKGLYPNRCLPFQPELSWAFTRMGQNSQQACRWRHVEFLTDQAEGIHIGTR